MTGFDERTVKLGDERDRLNDRLDTLAEKLGDVDSGTQSAQALQSVANEVDQQGRGVSHLIDRYGESAEVTINGLDAGGYALVEDRTADLREQSDMGGGNPGSSTLVWAATGLISAPFLDDGDDGLSEYERKLQSLSHQPVGVAKWVSALVNEETSVEGNWTPLSERIAATSQD